mmetsp:Transcript_42038/g.110726  ORF Transcript_42038/g.110726 Transcript_42038/m.110726 type:complete len:216 (+) Transcript_42038:53-700(+)
MPWVCRTPSIVRRSRVSSWFASPCHEDAPCVVADANARNAVLHPQRSGAPKTQPTSHQRLHQRLSRSVVRALQATCQCAWRPQACRALGMSPIWDCGRWMLIFVQSQALQVDRMRLAVRSPVYFWTSRRRSTCVLGCFLASAAVRSFGKSAPTLVMLWRERCWLAAAAPQRLGTLGCSQRTASQAKQFRDSSGVWTSDKSCRDGSSTIWRSWAAR